MEVKRLGYEPQSQIVEPDPDGSFGTVNVALALRDTGISLTWDHDGFDHSVLNVPNSQILLRGVPGTVTEGIQWALNAGMDDDGDPETLTIRNLLPGQYIIEPATESVLINYPGAELGVGADVLRTDRTLNATLNGTPFVVEVADGQIAEAVVEMERERSTLSGRLLGRDDGIDPWGYAYDGDYIGRFGMAGVEIEFVAHGDAALDSNAGVTFVVTTDADGNYLARLPAGLYGIRIPSLTDYHSDRPIGSATRRDTGGDAGGTIVPTQWPVPLPWAAGTAGSVRGPFLVDDRRTHDIDLLVNRNAVNYEVSFNTSISEADGAAEQFGTLPRLNVFDHYPVDWDLSTMDGSTDGVEITQPRRGRLHIGPLLPGTYALSGTHPVWDIETFSGNATETIVVPPFSPPGVDPTTARPDPGFPDNWQPVTPLNVPWDITVQVWNTTNTEYVEAAGCFSQITEFANAPGIYQIRSSGPAGVPFKPLSAQ